MIKSVLTPVKNAALILCVTVAVSLSFCFKLNMSEEEMLAWGNKCFTQSFDPTVDAKLKKWELELTPDAFIRMRKTYQNGKQEYFSFHLHRLLDMDYIGNTETGTLQFKTMADDIIVQTHNDRKGDLDTLATTLTIPVKNMGPERLDSLKMIIDHFQAKEL